MSGTLFVVATPIGNLEDITLRALRVLREADVIAAEDTRRTAKLLSHFAIGTRTISFHEHNAAARLSPLLERLGRGETVALVTDAGTPGISDPGLELIRACLAAGVSVDVLPGPSASLTAAVASGFPLDPLTLFGFPPIKAKDRTGWFERVSAVRHTFTFFEAPHRIKRTLEDLAKKAGNRPILVGRELTKVHQEFLRGHAADVIGRMANIRGEFTVVVGPDEASGPAVIRASDKDIASEFGVMTKPAPRGRRAAIASLAKKHGLSANKIYAIIEQQKISGE